MTERKFAVRVSSPSQCKRVLSIEIPHEELAKEEARVVEKLRRELEVPGFRKGKVPAKYVEKNYADAVHGDAVQNLLPEVYEDALAREGLKPVGEPKFDNLKAEKGSSITVDVVIEVRPEVEVKGYRGLKVKAKKREVGEKEVEEALGHLRERLASYVVVDREARDGDYVVIDYGPVGEDGRVDAKALKRNHPLSLGEESVVREFREGLLGMGLRDEKEIRVRYPDDFPEKALAGRERVYRVTMKEIKEKRVPELDDAFARRLGEQFGDLATLREKVKQDLTDEEEKRFQREVEERIIDSLIEQNPFDVPQAMVDDYIASVLEEDRKRRPGVPDERERIREVREHFEDTAVRTIKKFLVLEAVKKQEGVEVKDEEVEARIEKIAEGGGENAEEIRKYFGSRERRRGLKDQMTDEKVLELLRQSANVKAA